MKDRLKKLEVVEARLNELGTAEDRLKKLEQSSGMGNSQRGKRPRDQARLTKRILRSKKVSNSVQSEP